MCHIREENFLCDWRRKQYDRIEFLIRTVPFIFTLFFYFPTLNLFNAPIFLHCRNISFFPFNPFNLFFLLSHFFYSFLLFFPRLVAGSRFFFLLIFYRVQIRIMNMCYLQKTKKKEMHIIYTRGARRMGLGQEINWIYRVNSSQKVLSFE